MPMDEDVRVMECGGIRFVPYRSNMNIGRLIWRLLRPFWAHTLVQVRVCVHVCVRVCVCVFECVYVCSMSAHLNTQNPFCV